MFTVSEALYRWATLQRIPVFFEPGYPREDFPQCDVEQALPLTDTAVSLGGDGTFLRMAGALYGFDHTLIGINLGQLGFLTEFSATDLIDTLEKVKSETLPIKKRPYLSITLTTKNGDQETFKAINDMVINKAALSRIIGVDVFVGDDPMGEIRGDGMIVSTPIGSTAYSLAAGGPILFPTLEALTITPICPHTLTNRPLIISMDSRVTLRVVDDPYSSADIDVYLSIDGQRGHMIACEDTVCVERDPKTINLLSNPNHTYFDVLRNKLRMGGSITQKNGCQPHEPC